MKSNQHTYILSIAILIALFCTSCVKDKLYYTPHPNLGAGVVTADFSQRSESSPAPQEYTLVIGGESCTAPAGQPYCHPVKFLPGNYTLTAWNACDKMTTEGLNIRINTLSANIVHAMPGHLFTARQQITVIQDDTLHVRLTMMQRTRDLHFDLTVTEGDPELIASITGRLDGVAGVFDLEAQRPGADRFAVMPAFTRSGDKVTADARLLGLGGDGLTLTLDLTFTDGRTQHIESDMTDLLAGFNADDMTVPLTVKGNILTPIGAGFTATITDWEIIENEIIEIN